MSFEDRDEMLRRARMKLEEQQEWIDTVSKPPYLRGVVIAVNRDAKGAPTAVVTDGRAAMEMPARPGMKGLQVGAIVRTTKEMHIVDVADTDIMPYGPIVYAKELHGGHVLVDGGAGGERLVILPDRVKAEVGDKLVLDGMGVLVTRNLGRQGHSFKGMVETTAVWSDVGGQDAAVRDLIDAIETPLKNPTVYKRYGKRPPKGVLLYGPPGCGKTLLAEAAATSFAGLQGGKKGGFIRMKGPEAMNKYFGESERLVRDVFAAARDYERDAGQRAVLFIDEADSILSKRGSGGTRYTDTIVATFLAEMDGFEETGPLVILATNKADSLDPAIVRDGRIDRKVRVDRPNKEAAAAIFGIHLKGLPTEGGTASMAKSAAKNLYSDNHHVFEVKGQKFPLHKLVSGAMIAGIVDRASDIAVRRDIAAGRASALSLGDLEVAISATVGQVKDTDMSDDIVPWVHETFDHQASA